jgi:diguanylate cyclase (GGDEF)-like protein/PAS domain S-box-containing protein
VPGSSPPRGAAPGTARDLRVVHSAARTVGEIPELGPAYGIQFTERFLQSLVPMGLVSLDGEFLAVNGSLCEYVQTQGMALVGRPVTVLDVVEEGIAATAETFAQIRDGACRGLVAERQLRRGDGVVVHAAITLTVLTRESGLPWYVTVHYADITQRVHAERALQRTEARWRALMLNAVDIAYTADANCVISTATSALPKQLGWRMEEISGANGFDLIHPDDRALFRDHWQRVARGELPHAVVECRVRHADGSWRWMQETLSNLLEDPDVGAMVANVVDISRRKQHEAELAQLALHDGLTRLPNRALFLDRTEQALQRAAGSGPFVVVVCLDIDEFRAVNASYGHTVGDELLCAVAQRLLAEVDPEVTVARGGEDHYLVLAPEAPRVSAAAALAERLAAALGQPFDLSSGPLTITVSSGAAVSGSGAASDLVAASEAARRRAKLVGPGTVQVSDPVQARTARDSIALTADLTHALERREVQLHFQPIVDLARATVGAVEGLARWTHARRGMVSPSEFIPVAEETDLVLELGAQVLRQACEAAARWAGAPQPGTDHQGLKVAVNLSAHQMGDPGIVDLVSSTLAATGAPPESLILEVTESAVLGDLASTTERLAALRRLGVRLALDDFGTGYSSLTYLRRFPVTSLKIDRSFVAGMAENADDRAIVASVISLAQAVGMTCTAEGVETEKQLAALQELGCHQAQGYLWSPAVPAEQIPEVVTRIHEQLERQWFRGLGARSTEPRPAPRTEDERRIVELHLGGASLHTIAGALNAAGSRTERGRRWHANSVARVVAFLCAPAGLPAD